MPTQTQWAGQFAVAAELARRGYGVTFTLGNTPGHDILCRSPKGKSFAVEVKSVLGTQSLILGERLRPFLEQHSDVDPALAADFYVLVVIPRDWGKAPDFYLFEKQQLLNLYGAQLQFCKDREARGEAPYARFPPGIDQKVLIEFTKQCRCQNAWDMLPDYPAG